MLEALGLPLFTDIKSLSNYLGLSEKIIYLLSVKTQNYYKKFFLTKKRGGQREILAPSYSLKLVQRWILREILEKLPISSAAQAYIKGNGLGIKKNAEIHKNSLYILEIDFKDFFPSISRDKVFYLFRNIGYNILISNVLANLCTFENYLPQGGVCSPSLSNIICFKLDKRIHTLCLKRDINYSRYADDLAFSCDNKVSLIKSKHLISRIAKDEGFKLNDSKTRYLSPISHKIVTGITIDNGVLKAKKELKKLVRPMIFRSITSMDYTQNEKIRGIVAYVDSIEKGYKDSILKYIASLSTKFDFVVFEDIVREFNKHKFYKEVNDMVDKSKDYLSEEEFDDISDIIDIRNKYLKSIC